MPHIRANGIEIHYQFDGSEIAPVLLLSNSLGTNLGMWDEQISEFTSHFRVLRYDKRGHGQTEVPEGEYTIDQLGEDVVALLDVLQLEKVFYCGLSIGGMTGMWLARHAPERFERMVLSNTSPHVGPKELWSERIQTVLDNGMEGVLESVTQRWFTQEYIASAPGRLREVQEMILTTPPIGYAGCSAAIREMDQREVIKTIELPVLVISGAEDVATPAEHGRFIADAIPSAEYVEIANAAHLSNIEQTETYNNSVLKFLTT